MPRLVWGSLVGLRPGSFGGRAAFPEVRRRGRALGLEGPRRPHRRWWPLSGRRLEALAGLRAPQGEAQVADPKGRAWARPPAVAAQHLAAPELDSMALEIRTAWCS